LVPFGYLFPNLIPMQLGCGGLGTLLLVRRWTAQNSARLKLVDPQSFSAVCSKQRT